MTKLLADNSTSTASTSDAAVSGGGSQTLARIVPEKRITFQPVPAVLPVDEERAKTLRRGGLIAILFGSLLALPWGVKYWLAALLVFIVTYNIGVLTGVLTKSLSARVSRQRVARSGGVDYAGYSLTFPVDGEPYTFDLQEAHTLLRRFQRQGDQTRTELFIAQHEKQALLFSEERSDSETARDYGFSSDGAEDPIPQVPPVNRVEVPLRGLHELSRLMESKRKLPEDPRPRHD